MEKKKKRDKSCLNNAEANATEGLGSENQSKDADIQSGTAHPKPFYRVGSPAAAAQENAATAMAQSQNPPVLQWPYATQALPALQEQPVQFSCHGQQAALSIARHQQQQQQHHQSHSAQPNQNQQQSVPLWPQPHPEFQPTAAPPTASALYGFAQGSTDSTMISAPYTPAHSTTDHPPPPYGYHAGGYPYPLGYPGPWDPSWWMHSHHQPPYPYPYPPYGTGYGYMPPPVPPMAAGMPNAPLQKGVIRPPAGLSQRHQRLWEAQSMENVQLWGSLARLESELTACRGRIMKLESEFYTMKTQYDAAVADGGAVANTTTQTARKSRNKRGMNVATPNLPSPDQCQPRARGKRASTCKVAIAEEKEKNDTDKDRENKEGEKDKVGTSVTVPTAGQGHPIPQGELEKVQPVFTNGSEPEDDKSKTRLTSDFPSSLVCQNHVFASDTDNLQYNTMTQLNNFGALPGPERKGNENDQNVDKKTLVTGHSQILTNFMDNKTSDPADEASASYRAVNNRTNGWPSSSTANEGVRNLMLESRVQSFYEHGHVMRPDVLRSGKIMSGWGYVCEDASEEQDDVVPSGKEDEDEEMNEDTDSTLDEVRRSKGERMLRLDSVPGLPKGLTQLSRW